MNETYTEHFLPEVGRAAIECLEATGHKVTLATMKESPRIAISQELLDQAKVQGQQLFAWLDAMQREVPIIVCEPSSASALIQDLPDLVGNVEHANRVVMLDRFLEEGIAASRFHLPLQQTRCRFVTHTHCHQRHMDGGRYTQRLLSRIPGAMIVDTQAGCCGMAGSFGYEIEHTDISKVIAGQRLLSRLNKEPEDAIVVTNGFLCRHQIHDLTPRRPMHIAEVIRTFLDIS